MHHANTRRFHRRVLLRTVAVSAAGGVLAACGGSSTTVATTPATASAAMPLTTGARVSVTAMRGSGVTMAAGSAPAANTPGATSMSATSVTPGPTAAAPMDGKLPAPVEGVPDAYTKTPAPFKSYEGKPGRGGTVTSFTIAYNAPPPPRNQNQFWQELEKRLGVTWEPTITPQPDYGAKSAALIAGDLPELFYLNPGQNAAPQYKAMEQGAFLDLTPYVTGDAVKEYRNFATFPQYLWDNVKFKGKIYGVPKPVQRSGNIPFYRADWAKKLGKDVPKSPDDVHDLLVAFAKGDPDGNGQTDTFGMGRYGTDWNAWDNTLRNMFGVSFNWRKNPDGTFTHMIEIDEYRQSLDFQRRLFADGAYYPDAAGQTFAQAQGNFIAGKTGLHTEGFGSLVNPAGGVYLKLLQGNPKAELFGLLPPAASGRTAVTYNTTGFFGFTGIPAKVRDKERVKELLRVLDYLAAPFGSEEWVFLNYGIEGVDHDVKPDGSRVLNDRGRSERGDLIYTMGGLPAFYFPETPGLAEQAQRQAYAILKIGLDDPTQTLYSPTNVTKASELNQLGLDRATAIVTGREPLSALDTAIKDWRSRGGDQIRKEYQDALKGQ